MVQRGLNLGLPARLLGLLALQDPPRIHARHLCLPLLPLPAG